MGGEQVSKAKNLQLLPSLLVPAQWPVQNLLWSVTAQLICKGTAAVVDLRAQSNYQKEEKWQEGEVSGSDASGEREYVGWARHLLTPFSSPSILLFYSLLDT